MHMSQVFEVCGVVLLILGLSSGTPQKESATPRVSSSIPAAAGEMTFIHAASSEMGIAQSEIPDFERTFKINRADVFQVAVPRHSVSVSNFYMDRRLVTKAEFKRFIDANPKWRPNQIASSLHNGNYLKEWAGNNYPVGLAGHPVVNVSWYAAVAYCQWSGKRLPTEAEWEYAARGGLKQPLFPWGDDPPDKKHANYLGARIGTTTDVGSYLPNGYGLYDMAGNVWEYLADEWAPYSAGAQTNPVAGGELYASGEGYLGVKGRRVIRGGSFGGAPVNLWVEYRDSHPVDGSREFVGFRCAKSGEGR